MPFQEWWNEALVRRRSSPLTWAQSRATRLVTHSLHPRCALPARTRYFGEPHVERLTGREMLASPAAGLAAAGKSSHTYAW